MNGTMRTMPARTWGSGRTLNEDLPIPGLPYHGGRALRWCWRHPVVVGAAVVYVMLLRSAGPRLGTVLMVLLLAGGLTAWLGYGQRPREAQPLTRAEALRALRRRGKLQRRWNLACAAGNLTGIESRRDIPRLRLDWQPTQGGGWHGRMVPARIGRTVSDVQSAASTLAEIIGCRDVVVTPAGPGACELDFHWTDPIGRHLPITHLPVAPAGRLAYGVRADGTAATIRYGQSVLIGGLTASGKSSCLHALVADANRQKLPLRLYVSDPKGGVELDAYERQLGRKNGTLEVRQYARSVPETIKMIESVEGAMKKRQAEMKARRVRTWEPSDYEPLVVVVLDEALLLADVLKKGHDSALARIAFTGRAAGYVLWPVAQVGHADVLGRLRDMIPQRICFATPTPQVTDTFLGMGASGNGAACHRINVPGVGYSYSDTDRTPLKFRAAFVSDQDLQVVVTGRVPRGMVRRDGQETALYRWFDVDDRLLYVGISNDPGTRTDQHAKSKEWMKDSVRSTVEWLPNRKAALAAEKRAILAEKPMHNVVHNTGNPWRRVADGTRSKAAAAREKLRTPPRDDRDVGVAVVREESPEPPVPVPNVADW